MATFRRFKDCEKQLEETRGGCVFFTCVEYFVNIHNLF